MGIPGNDKEKIFERGCGKGHGFGLFLVREILSLTDITRTDVTLKGFGKSKDQPVIGDWKGSNSYYPTLNNKGDRELDTAPPYGVYSEIDAKISGMGSKNSIPFAWEAEMIR